MFTYKPFRMNTSKKCPQVFILKVLEESLSSLESALMKKREGEGEGGKRGVISNDLLP
jgi:hypothetical protein